MAALEIDEANSRKVPIQSRVDSIFVTPYRESCDKVDVFNLLKRIALGLEPATKCEPLAEKFTRALVLPLVFVTHVDVIDEKYLLLVLGWLH